MDYLVKVVSKYNSLYYLDNMSHSLDYSGTRFIELNILLDFNSASIEVLLYTNTSIVSSHYLQHTTNCSNYLESIILIIITVTTMYNTVHDKLQA